MKNVAHSASLSKMPSSCTKATVSLVGWVALEAKPMLHARSDGYRYAQPILWSLSRPGRGRNFQEASRGLAAQTFFVGL